MACKIPSPSVTAQALLNAILCQIKSWSLAPTSGQVSPSRTRNTGATAGWVALPAEIANDVSIYNYTSADLDIRKADATGSTQFITIADGQTVVLTVASNASEIEVRGAGVAPGVNYVLN